MVHHRNVRLHFTAWVMHMNIGDNSEYCHQSPAEHRSAFGMALRAMTMLSPRSACSDALKTCCTEGHLVANGKVDEVGVHKNLVGRSQLCVVREVERAWRLFSAIPSHRQYDRLGYTGGSKVDCMQEVIAALTDKHASSTKFRQAHSPLCEEENLAFDVVHKYSRYSRWSHTGEKAHMCRGA